LFEIDTTDTEAVTLSLSIVIDCMSAEETEGLLWMNEVTAKLAAG